MHSPISPMACTAPSPRDLADFAELNAQRFRPHPTGQRFTPFTAIDLTPITSLLLYSASSKIQQLVAKPM